jgi:hypothetical protein
MQADISIQTLRACLGGPCPCQLAIEGRNSPVGILRDLAEDLSFRGTVICELDTPLLERWRWNDCGRFRDYHPRSRLEYLETLAHAWIGSKTAAVGPGCTLRSMLVRLFDAAAAPRPERVAMSFARQWEWDFDSVQDLHAFRRRAAERYRERYQLASKIAPFDSLIDEIKEVDDLVGRIKARGGNVAFVRLPSGGEHWKIEEEYHQRAATWDRFASATHATCLHFRDVPEMCAFSPPDESHLDFRDAPRFTQVLLQELRRRGVLR